MLEFTSFSITTLVNVVHSLADIFACIKNSKCKVQRFACVHISVSSLLCPSFYHDFHHWRELITVTLYYTVNILSVDAFLGGLFATLRMFACRESPNGVSCILSIGHTTKLFLLVRSLTVAVSFGSGLVFYNFFFLSHLFVRQLLRTWRAG